MPSAGKSTPSADGALSAILLDSLKALADAGDAEQACRLAGRACVALRHGDMAQWRRFNALLHRLTPRTGPLGRHVRAGPAATDDGPDR